MFSSFARGLREALSDPADDDGDAEGNPQHLREAQDSAVAPTHEISHEAAMPTETARLPEAFPSMVPTAPPTVLPPPAQNGNSSERLSEQLAQDAAAAPLPEGVDDTAAPAETGRLTEGQPAIVPAATAPPTVLPPPAQNGNLAERQSEFFAQDPVVAPTPKASHEAFVPAESARLYGGQPSVVPLVTAPPSVLPPPAQNGNLAEIQPQLLAHAPTLEAANDITVPAEAERLPLAAAAPTVPSPLRTQNENLAERQSEPPAQDSAVALSPEAAYDTAVPAETSRLTEGPPVMVPIAEAPPTVLPPPAQNGNLAERQSEILVQNPGVTPSPEASNDAAVPAETARLPEELPAMVPLPTAPPTVLPPSGPPPLRPGSVPLPPLPPSGPSPQETRTASIQERPLMSPLEQPGIPNGSSCAEPHSTMSGESLELVSAAVATPGTVQTAPTAPCEESQSSIKPPRKLRLARNDATSSGEFADDAHLEALLCAVSAEVADDDDADFAALADAAALTSAEKLDVVVVGPPRTGKSTIANCLLERILCCFAAGAGSAILPIAVTVASRPDPWMCSSGSSPKADYMVLRVPAGLRAVLGAATSMAKEDDAQGVAHSLPEDGIVTSTSDLIQRLASLNSVARASAAALLKDPATAAEPVEVQIHRRVAGTYADMGLGDMDFLLQRWRLVDMPSPEQEEGKAADLVASILERRLRAPTTAMLLCVAAADQVGTAATSSFFAPILKLEKQRIWLVNKVDNKDDYLELQARWGQGSRDRQSKAKQAKSGKLKQLTSDEPVFYISAMQILAYRCAETLARQDRSSGADVQLPPFGSTLQSAKQREVEAIVRALVPAASSASMHWREQYEDARNASWAQLCRATQFPVTADRALRVECNSAENEVNEQDSDHSCNGSLRYGIQQELRASRLSLVLRQLHSVVARSVREVVGEKAGLSTIQQASEQRARAWTALQKAFTSDVDAGIVKGKLSKAIVEIAERHIGQVLQDLRVADSEHMTKMSAALENLEAGLVQLQRDSITRADTALEQLCNEFDVLEPVKIIDQLQGQAGISPGFECVLLKMFTRSQSDITIWLESTCRFYLDGIRAAAWATAKLFVDATRSRISVALERMEDDLAQGRHELAVARSDAVKIGQRRSLLTCIICMQGSSLADYELLSEEQQEFLLHKSVVDDSDSVACPDCTFPEDACIERGNALAELSATHPEWTRWASKGKAII